MFPPWMGQHMDLYEGCHPANKINSFDKSLCVLHTWGRNFDILRFQIVTSFTINLLPCWLFELMKFSFSYYLLTTEWLLCLILNIVLSSMQFATWDVKTDEHEWSLTLKHCNLVIKWPSTEGSLQQKLKVCNTNLAWLLHVAFSLKSFGYKVKAHEHPCSFFFTSIVVYASKLMLC